jgi:hypothetical protein
VLQVILTAGFAGCVACIICYLVLCAGLAWQLGCFRWHCVVAAFGVSGEGGDNRYRAAPLSLVAVLLAAVLQAAMSQASVAHAGQTCLSVREPSGSRTGSSRLGSVRDRVHLCCVVEG